MILFLKDHCVDNKEENMIEGTISKEIIKDVQTLNMLSTISLPCIS